MADTKLSALTAITGLNIDRTADYLLLYDASATTDKKTLVGEAAIAFANATGQVLQVVAATDAGSSTTDTTSPPAHNVNMAVVPITPKSTSSHLLIEVQFLGSEQASAVMSTVANFQIYDFTASALIGQPNSLAADRTVAEGTAISAPCCLRAYIANTALTLRSFELRANTSDASAAAGATSHVWSITEIKD